MGVVYEAWDREHETTVALKALRDVNAQALLRFKQEFRGLQHIGHPNLVRLGEFIEDRGQWFFTMELVDGVDFLSYVRPGGAPAPHHDFPSADTFPDTRSLHTFAHAPGSLDVSRLRRSFSQLVRGLIALHDASKIHRDVKPSNILVSDEGRVVLLDFGLTTDVLSVDDSSAESIVGTAAYMAPEQAAATMVGPEADWYSAGVVLYEALTGRLPFEGQPIQILLAKQEREPPRPSSVARHVDRALDALCVELLRTDPDDRPRGSEVLQRLGVDETGSHRALLGTQLTPRPPFVGRAAELGALRDAFEASRQGRAVAMVVRGESGVGKTELVTQFTNALTHEDPRVVHLSGRCYERESLPYKGFDGIADSLSRHLTRMPDADAEKLLPENASLLGRLFPVMLRVEAIARCHGTTAQDMDPVELRTRVFRVLRELFGRMAGTGPVVLVVDDFQWADADSLTLLTELLHPPEPPPMLFIATVRSENPEALENFVRAMEPWGGDVRVTDVTRLTDETSRELVTLLAPELAEQSPAALASIVRETEGHPLFLQELVRHLQDGDALDATGIHLDDALWARVCRLPTHAKRLLETLCVAGAPISQEVANLATKQEYEDHERATSLLRVACLARTHGVRQADAIEPYHDRIREAVLARLDRATRLHHHERLAISLERSGAGTYDPHVLVRHLEASGKAADAARRAYEAARKAGDALAFDRAAELYRAALRLGHPVGHNAEALRALADALANAGRGLEAAEAYVMAAADTDPALRLQCRRRASEQLLRSGHLDEGLAELARVLDQIGISIPSTPRRAFVALVWCRVRLRLRGLRWTPRAEREVPDTVLTRVDTYRVVGHALGMVDNIHGAHFQTRGLLSALRSGERRRILLAMCAEALYIASQGGRALRRGRSISARVRELLTDQDDGLLHGWHAASDGIITYFEGRFPDAAQSLTRAVRLFREQSVGTAWELNTARMFRMFALKHAGKLREVERLYGRYLRNAERVGDHYIATSTRRYGTFLWLARDQPDTAKENLAQATWVPPEGRFHLQHWFEMEAQGELALYEGRATEELELAGPQYGELKASLLLRVQIIRCLSSWLRGRLLVASAAETGDPGPLAEAQRIANKLGKETVPHAVAWSHMLHAGVCAQRGDERSAVQQLQRATTVADPGNIALYVAGAQRQLGRLLGGDEGAGLVLEADELMSTEGVVSPGRMAALIVPGLAGDG